MMTLDNASPGISTPCQNELVPKMTEGRLEEIYTARLSLEGELVKRAVNGITEEKLIALESIDHQLDLAGALPQTATPGQLQVQETQQPADMRH